MAALKVPQLEARLSSQAESAEPPGLIAFDGDRAVGWVSLGPRTGFERIVRSRLIPAIDDRPVWSIGCFAVSAPARGQGVSLALLDGAIAHARARARGVSTAACRDRTDATRARGHSGCLPRTARCRSLRQRPTPSLPGAD